MPTHGHADAAQRALVEGRAADAVRTLRTALRRDPHDPEALSLLTTALMRSGDAAGAEGSARTLTRLLPDDFRVWHNLGNMMLHFGRALDAEEPLLRARTLAPADANVMLALSNVYTATDRWTAARQACSDGLAGTPDDTRLIANLAVALHGAGRVEEAVPLFRRACELAPGRLDHADGLAAISTYAPGVTPEESLALHRRYGELLEGAVTPLPPQRPRADRVLTVGILSPDLRDHAVARFTLPLLRDADPAAVRFICYSVAAREDAFTSALRAYAHAWRHVPFESHSAIAQRVRSDGVDVLLDLAGHTRGHRLPVFALRPAPVQAAWMGYPNTTGLSRMDARMVDSLTDPAGTDGENTERLVRTDPCFVAFPPSRTPAPAGRGPGAPITFASFSSLLKFNDALLRSWSAVLAATPGSTLVLKHHALSDEGVRADLARRFEAAGLAPGRVRLDQPAPTSEGVLAAYDGIDIALDTFPYAGTTTTCEALSMGVPVVTRVGATSASRVGRSLLAAVGMQELCATTERGFIETAVQLALDRPRLEVLRARLRGTYHTSALADARAFAARMVHAIAAIGRPAGCR